MVWNAKNGRVPIGDTEMDYVSFGHGPAPLVLLPGLSDGLATVRGKALLLAPPYRRFFDRYTVYLFSRKNEMPSGYSIRDMASDQAKAFDALGVKNACVVGVSQGGMIAQYLAIDRPDLVQSLILAVTAPNANDTARACVRAWIDIAKSGDHKALMIDTAERSYSPACLQKYRRLYPILGAIGKPKTYDRFLCNANAILGFDARESLSEIACPTLIIGGENDRIVGANASRELHEAIQGSRLYLYPGLGHAAYEEAPDFYERIDQFLEESMKREAICS